MGMNSTERRALRWIAMKFGIEGSSVTFSHTRTPDFTLPDGSEYEVKRLYGDKIIFFPSQLFALHNHVNAKVLVFRNGELGPTAIIPVNEVLEIIEGGRNAWHNVKIVLYEQNSLKITIRGEVWMALNRYVANKTGSIRKAGPLVAKMAIEEFLEKRGYLKSVPAGKPWTVEKAILGKEFVDTGGGE